MARKILFLSGIDFKEKSIQVIRKTPEAYVSLNWQVDYLVARDNSRVGNYYYEETINPKGVNVIRFFWPFANFRSVLRNKYLLLLYNKLSSFIVIFRLFRAGSKIAKQKKYDVIYGYEVQGVLAMQLLRFFYRQRGVVYISRFQGTFIYEMIANRQYSRLFFNMDVLCALKCRTNLLIMTDDGTQGDKALKCIHKNRTMNVLFIPNGVDEYEVDLIEIDRLRKEFDVGNKFVFLSVSRLVAWKRVERNISILKSLIDHGMRNVILIIIGEGNKGEELRNLVAEYDIQSYVRFVGAVNHKKIMNYYAISDIFISMYESSNVGNPLLEAIRMNKIVVTLRNGDTGMWIEHMKNGLIYDEDTHFLQIAADIKYLIEHPEKRAELRCNLEEIASGKLRTWEQRMKIEINSIERLLA